MPFGGRLISGSGGGRSSRTQVEAVANPLDVVIFLGTLMMMTLRNTVKSQQIDGKIVADLLQHKDEPERSTDREGIAVLSVYGLHLM